MKKTILITLGIALIGIVAGVWVYLIMFGPPSTVNDVLTKFSFGGNSSPTIVATGTSTVDTSSLTNTGVLQPLRQLTTRPVAGAAFIDGGIRYVEKGTGYIYDIDLSSGQESLAGGTTIPQAVGAVFSPSGNRLAITAEKKDSHEITVGTITRNDAGEGVLDGIRLPENTHDVAFDNSGEKLWYLKETNAGTEGHEFDIPKQSDRTLFSIPLKDVRALWGKDTYIYTTPSVAQTGYIYKVDNGSLQYLREGGLGLMGIEYRGGLIVSDSSGGKLHSTAYENGNATLLPVQLFPEKCADVPLATSSLICANALPFPEGHYPDDWYKGLISLSDQLWSVDTEKGEATLLSDFAGESGRQIDVADIGTNADGTSVWFINKNDDTLWMFDTTLKQ